MEGAGANEAQVVRDAAEPVLRALAGGNPLDQAEVPDLLGTVIERVLARLRVGDDIEDLPKYAKKAARNVFTDYLRSRRRQRKHIHRDVNRGTSSTPLVDRLYSRGSLTPSSLVVERDDQRRHAPMIEAALASLTPVERAVIELRFAEGRSSSDVADRLGYKSAAVVDVTVSRARRKLREQLPLSLMNPILGL